MNAENGLTVLLRLQPSSLFFTSGRRGEIFSMIFLGSHRINLANIVRILFFLVVFRFNLTRLHFLKKKRVITFSRFPNFLPKNESHPLFLDGGEEGDREASQSAGPGTIVQACGT